MSFITGGSEAIPVSKPIATQVSQNNGPVSGFEFEPIDLAIISPLANQPFAYKSKHAIRVKVQP